MSEQWEVIEIKYSFCFKQTHKTAKMELRFLVVIGISMFTCDMVIDLAEKVP